MPLFGRSPDSYVPFSGNNCQLAKKLYALTILQSKLMTFVRAFTTYGKFTNFMRNSYLQSTHHMKKMFMFLFVSLCSSSLIASTTLITKPLNAKDMMVAIASG